MVVACEVAWRSSGDGVRARTHPCPMARWRSPTRFSRARGRLGSLSCVQRDPRHAPTAQPYAHLSRVRSPLFMTFMPPTRYQRKPRALAGRRAASHHFHRLDVWTLPASVMLLNQERHAIGQGSRRSPRAYRSTPAFASGGHVGHVLLAGDIRSGGVAVWNVPVQSARVFTGLFQLQSTLMAMPAAVVAFGGVARRAVLMTIRRQRRRSRRRWRR